MYKPEIEDLQFQVFQLKKLNLDVKSENQLLKVKLRKLQDEINKKNRQLDQILDPKKSSAAAKAISNHGVTLIMKLKEENFTLYKKLAEKDLFIKRLQNELDTIRVYINEKSKITSAPLKLFDELLGNTPELSDDNSCGVPTARLSNKRRSRSACNNKRSKSASSLIKESDLEKNYLLLLNNNLQKIKQNNNLQADSASTKPVEPDKIDMPHEEIQQLQSYLFNVLNEVDYLKGTIRNLQREQVKTSFVLNDKNTSLNKPVSDPGSLKSDQPRKYLQNERKISISDISEALTTDVSLSKSTTCVQACESDFNESIEDSTSVTKYPPNEIKDEDKTRPFISVSIQTTRSFCTCSLATEDPKITTENKIVDVDEYGVEVEYID